MDFYLLLKILIKILSNKYGQKLVDSAKKSATDALKTSSRRAIQRATEATGDPEGSKIADKIISISKKPAKQLQDDELQSNETNNEIPKERT